MRKIIVLVLAVSLGAWSVNVRGAEPIEELGMAQEQLRTISGVVRGATPTQLAGLTVRVRNLDTGEMAGMTTVGEAGEFAFIGLQPGRYVIEIVNAAGDVVAITGINAVLSLSEDGTASTAEVVLSVIGAANPTTAGAAGGLASFFTARAAIVLLSAATAGITFGLIAARPVASGSR